MSGDTSLEVKDGKVSLNQKPLRWDQSRSALQELLDFSDFMKLPTTQTPCTELPSTCYPLIAKLVIESDKTLQFLVRNVKKTLMLKCDNTDDKAALDDVRLPQTAITTAIESIAERVNYGLQATPAALAVWRWEIKDPSSMLPPSSVDAVYNGQTATTRRESREMARQTFTTSYSAMDENQRNALFTVKEKQKRNGKGKDAQATVTEAGPSSSNQNEVKVTPNKEPRTSSKKDAPPAEPAKPRQTLHSFFGKPSVPKAATTQKSAAKVSSANDFDRVFKPFLLKKDSLLAPVNAFQSLRSAKAKGKSKAKDEVIVLDDDGDIEMSIAPTSTTKQGPQLPNLPDSMDLNSAALHALLFPSVSPSRMPKRHAATSSSTKGSKPLHRLSVREIIAKLAEAEVTDDVISVRHYEKLLKSRKRIPVKYLQFSEDMRPAYYGSFTKSSAMVGPRTPFAKDSVTFDYTYDSGEEWEEEPEDAEEVVSSAGDDEEDDGTPEEDEFDDWLVGDDVVDGEGDAKRATSRSVSPAASSAKRKHDAEKETEKETKKRKVVKVLIPYVSGPFWEDGVGAAPNHLQAFRIQLLNDTPYPIDPFTFVSSDCPSPEAATSAMAEMRLPQAAPKTVAPILSDGFVVPALPPHLHPSSQINVGAPMPDASGLSTPIVKKAAKERQPAPPFPDEYLPQLLHAIEGSTLTKNGLMEQLKELFRPIKAVKLTVMVANVPQLAEREKGVWKVKTDYRHRLAQ